MTNTSKTKFNYKKKLLLILLCLFLLVGWFYCFQYRPAKIRQDCSWIKHHEDAIPAIPSKTVEELSWFIKTVSLGNSVCDKIRLVTKKYKVWPTITGLVGSILFIDKHKKSK